LIISLKKLLEHGLRYQEVTQVARLFHLSGDDLSRFEAKKRKGVKLIHLEGGNPIFQIHLSGENFVNKNL